MEACSVLIFLASIIKALSDLIKHKYNAMKLTDATYCEAKLKELFQQRKFTAYWLVVCLCLTAGDLYP